MTIGIPAPNASGCALLAELGFEGADSSFRMVRGPLAATGDPTRIFAIAGGDVG